MDLGLFGAGLVLGMAAVGSGFGVGACAQAAIGAWKRCYITNKAAPMTLLVFAGMPLTQTFYGYILMGEIKTAAFANPDNSLLYLGFSIASGLAICFSAFLQGKAGASACDAMGETGKGFAQYVAVVGIIEPIALFAMVLTMISL
jgi:V/A-type H+-transporting ATPase subunit K